MSNAIVTTPPVYNEPVKSFLPGSNEKHELKNELQRQLDQVVEIPLIIGGKEVKTSEIRDQVCPHDHGHRLATFSLASDVEIRQAIDAALKAKTAREDLPWQERAAIFLKAADLISTKYSPLINAATMLGQSKNVFQAEIDATCELADFFRFNVRFMEELYSQQPTSERGIWNRVEYRPLEGFVFALTPFNFTHKRRRSTQISGNGCKIKWG